MAEVLDGASLALEVRSEVAEGVRSLVNDRQVTPGLAAVLVGDGPASAVYVRNKRRACDEAASSARPSPCPVKPPNNNCWTWLTGSTSTPVPWHPGAVAPPSSDRRPSSHRYH